VESPKITHERVVDGRGNRVCDLAKVSVKTENGRRSVWLVRGLVRSDSSSGTTSGPAPMAGR
jgi:hypothetical protein